MRAKIPLLIPGPVAGPPPPQVLLRNRLHDLARLDKAAAKRIRKAARKARLMEGRAAV